MGCLSALSPYSSLLTRFYKLPVSDRYIVKQQFCAGAAINLLKLVKAKHLSLSHIIEN